MDRKEQSHEQHGYGICSAKLSVQYVHLTIRYTKCRIRNCLQLRTEQVQGVGACLQTPA